MKKVSRIVLSLLLVAALVMSNVAVPAKVDAASSYGFKYNGVTIYMGNSATKFIKKAGKPVKKTEKKSCAYNGKDRTYKYKYFTLTTYSKSNKGTEYANSVTITSKKVSTAEGIKIGDSVTNMTKKYGKNSGKFGVYTYTKGKSKLIFTTNSKKVITKIQYVMK